MNKQIVIVIILVGLFISAFTTIRVTENKSNSNYLVITDDTTKNNTDSTFLFRDGDLFSEEWDFDLMTNYSTNAPGTSERYDRSFENAPPMIPHSTEGLVPIKKDLNMCLTCHLPAVAIALKSTPIPESHFTEYRPVIDPEDVDRTDKLIHEENLNGQLDQARYNCTLCHAPQANTTIVIDNIFTPEFRAEQDKINSNLHENSSEGIK